VLRSSYKQLHARLAYRAWRCMYCGQMHDNDVWSGADVQGFRQMKAANARRIDGFVYDDHVQLRTYLHVTH
jgi:hypothetical protein